MNFQRSKKTGKIEEGRKYYSQIEGRHEVEKYDFGSNVQLH